MPPEADVAGPPAAMVSKAASKKAAAFRSASLIEAGVNMLNNMDVGNYCVIRGRCHPLSFERVDKSGPDMECECRYASNMKTIKSFAICAAVAGSLALAGVSCKTEDHSQAMTASTGVKPYPLKKCIVTDEELEAGKAYTFVRDGQEIKLCCKDCLADFDKDPKKYMAKLNGK